MPVLPTATQSQPWITNRTNSGESRGFFTVSPRTFALRTPHTPSLAAETETEISQSSPTQKPSNEVIGGAFIGAFLGALLLIFLLVSCCGGRRESSEDGSSDSSLTASKDPPAPQPVYQVPPRPPNLTGGYAVPGVSHPKPVYQYNAPKLTERSRGTTQRPRGSVAIAEVEGIPNWIRRNPRPRRPPPHSAAGSESTSSSRDRRRRKHLRRGEGVRIIELDMPRNLGYLHSAT